MTAQLIPKEVFNETIMQFLAPVRQYLEDPAVSEVMINGPGKIYIERQGKLQKVDEVFPNVKSLYAALRNTAQVMAAGATILSGLVGKVDVPRRSGVTNTYWVSESAALTEAEATFDKVSLTPKTLGALSKMSRLMVPDGFEPRE